MSTQPLTRPPGYWGKIKIDPRSAQVTSWLPLADHCMDVSLVFRRLLELPLTRRRVEAAAHGPLSAAQLDRLAVVALLHDMGKANLGFQNKVFDPKAPRAGHIRELLPLFVEPDLAEALAGSLRFQEFERWFDPPESCACYLFAALSHHGSPFLFDPSEKCGNYYPAKTRWWRPSGNLNPVAAIGMLIEKARELFPAAFSPDCPPLPGAPALQHRFAGLLTLADWLGSHEGLFPFDTPEQGRAGFSRRQAEASPACEGIDLTHAMDDWFSFGASPVCGDRPYLPVRLAPSGHYTSERLTMPYSGELPARAALSQLANIARLPKSHITTKSQTQHPDTPSNSTFHQTASRILCPCPSSSFPM